ncbi:viperin family antiviral radical SAM protein [Dactylosporangium salmoneum]|uniref:S-adenosylmethionine-dependent nucleotide dehydratase n=1 Tax=Dactylosporangium salmoneum TaxID=53361 RepID=A0ABN3GJI4_9ACTN
MSELVVNLHVTERCNYSCTFCFGKWDGAASDAEVFRTQGRAVIQAVFDAVSGQFPGVRFTFAGGEPGLLPSLPDLMTFCRSLGARVSFVSNGLVLRRLGVAWVRANVDMVGISVDSALTDTNRRIGRATRDGSVLDLAFLADSFRKLAGGPTLKVNTVVSADNWQEDLSPTITALAPHVWKIFQTLPVYGEQGTITPEQFHAFLARHAALAGLMVPEDNEEMTGSYLMVDPLGRFFWRDPSAATGYRYSAPILQAGAAAAFAEAVVSWPKYDRRYAHRPR